MNPFRKLQFQKAAVNRDAENLDHSHLTSLDFGQIIPATSIELLPSDDVRISLNSFSRCSPLVFPVYGKADQKFMSVFVPYHTVAYDADAFFDGETTFEGKPVVGRFITQGELLRFFHEDDVSDACTSSNYDWKEVNNTGAFVYFKLTNKGRYWYKVLRSLGYCIPQNVDMRSGSTWINKLAPYKLSAYPLIAYIKAYNDYLNSSTRYQISPITSMLNAIKYNNDDFYVSTGGTLRVNVLNVFFGNYYLHYESDYFTSAWRYPNQPIQDSGYSVNQADYVNGHQALAQITSDSENVGTSLSVSSGAVNLNARTLQMIQAFDSWIRRNNYVGGRNLERLFARFGIKSELYHKDKSEMVGNVTSIPMTIGDVTSTAQTDDMNLGDYAGKGIISGEPHKASYKSHDYGLFVTFTWINVRPIYYQGMPRHILNNKPLDWYNPEFDAVGPDAISFMELSNDTVASSASSLANPLNVFGYTERYNYLKFGGQLDRITGDLLLYDDLQKWHFGRDMADIVGRQYNAQSAEIIRFNPQSQYDRIFANSSHDADHFFLTMRIDCSAIRPMKNLNKSTGLPSGDLTVERNGAVIQ